MSRRVVSALATAAVALAIVWAALATFGTQGDAAPSAVPSRAPASTAVASAPEGTRAGTPGPPQSGEPTATPAAPIAVLVGAGDIAECTPGGDAATADLVERIEGTVFTLGDNAYDSGTFAEFQQCYGPTWGRPSILSRTRPTAGNHEYHTAGAAGYFRYFGAAAGDPATGYYAFDAGAWRIYALNSNCEEVGGCGTGSTQERWLRGDLAANPRACVAALWHHPRFSSGEHGSQAFMADLWRTLYDAGAELVLAGHDHSYERFGPQTASGQADPARGIVELVVGTGGRDPYAFRSPLANSLVRESPVFGVLRLELAPASYAFEFIPVDGESFTDSGSGNCH